MPPIAAGNQLLKPALESPGTDCPADLGALAKHIYRPKSSFKAGSTLGEGLPGLF